MVRSAIIIILVNCCASLFSQEFRFSRNFETRKKNIPVQIINNHPSYFHVLRINYVVHDITIERRIKPSAEIVAFTPLKLDSVNASWFDYENLDYILFEANNKLYFLFEKVLNTKRTVYLKIIDTTGKSSGFIELANLESDKNTEAFHFNFSQTVNNNILMVASKTALNGIIRRVALLFSTQKREIIWTKQLPLENDIEISSWSFTCNEKNDLLYLQSRSSIIGTETFGGITHTRTRLDSLVFCDWKASSAKTVYRPLNLSKGDYIRQGTIIPDSNAVVISFLTTREDTIKNDWPEIIVNIKLDGASGKQIYNTSTNYDEEIRRQLTFYDGPQKESYFKNHQSIGNHVEHQFAYSLFARSEKDYYKELLFRKTNLRNGEVVSQKIIPRKIFFFAGRTRYKNFAEPMVHFYGDSLKITLIEHASNRGSEAGNYKYKTFKKLSGPRKASVVIYSLCADGVFKKKEIYRNSNYELIPLNYYSTEQKDMVFYLNNSKFEKFAILQMYQ
ncbi:hypothetical protein [Aurantibacillus circumpalustris]|uniref:hypothetical protein n=1 Tax=Aurantibacillus circumpalustris TaxID=3036359 RepID=UPI00295ABA65|nr:hypothetical protein [Aurantibacillus circumpalustris]